MGNIIHPQKKEIKGPWLLNQEDFETLNDIVVKIDQLLYLSWENKISNEIQEENKDISEEELSKLLEETKLKSWYNKHNKKCVITSKDEIKLSDISIIGLLKDKTLEQLKPKSFNVNISHGGLYENSFELKVSNFYKGSLEYDINCSDLSLKDDIQYEIDKWIDKRKPNRALRIWSNYGDFITAIFIVPIIFLAYQSFASSHISYNESIRLELYELGQAGIDETNRNLALELLTKLQSGYMPSGYEPTEKENDPIWIKVFVISIFIYLASFFRPKTLLGLGKMKNKLVYYKIWIKVVLITIPTVLIIGPFWKFILKWFY